MLHSKLQVYFTTLTSVNGVKHITVKPIDYVRTHFDVGIKSK